MEGSNLKEVFLGFFLIDVHVVCETYMIDRQLQLPQLERFKVCCISFGAFFFILPLSFHLISGHCPLLNFVVDEIKWFAKISLIVVCLQLVEFGGISVADVGA